MYWDDGEVIVDSFDKHNYYHWTFKYTADDNGASLSIKMEHRANSLEIPTLDLLEIFNYRYEPDLSSFTRNGNQRVFLVHAKGLINLSTADNLKLTWKHKPAEIRNSKDEL
ncbi:unnamed protein product [Nippostrongylus brasiliensis]|uniref:Secreted protein n=1 Tax=Nippostrongylus brasiliensis TaxID=27835 RepID=A0A0N4XX55_NIPBR|nr:unnamed protein product [Nippostrongylus brasiliensis]